MATREELVRAEQTMRELLDENDLPQPDTVEYGHGTIWLHWTARKLVVAVDVDQPPPAGWPEPATAAD